QLYEHYQAYRDARIAARINMDYQLARLKTGTGILINVLQSITDWGNTVSSEATSLTQYNTLLATLERQTGTILESHGVVFFEERFGSVGPLGRFFEDQCYPKATRPTPNEDRYPNSDKPAEEKFDLVPPPNLRDELPSVPYDDIKLPTLEESFPNLLDPPKQKMEVPESAPSNLPPGLKVPQKSRLKPSENGTENGRMDETLPDGSSQNVIDRNQSRGLIELTSNQNQMTEPVLQSQILPPAKPKTLMQKSKAWLGRWK
ncbi:MAG: TolC family protein, partial [Planctomycetaceae bacterium]|nr:TolC family protein [Planctomycetaceae bacterium]